MSIRPGQRGFFLGVFRLCLGIQVSSLWLSGGFHAEFGKDPNLGTSGTPRGRNAGFSEAAKELAGDERFRRAGLMVCSDAAGEGAFIAEVAARQACPGHIVPLASKTLAKMSWSVVTCQLRCTTPEDVQKYLESIPVAVLVLDLTGQLNKFVEN